MFDFIEQHKRAFLVGAIVIVVGLMVTLFLISKNQSAPDTNSNTDPNEPGYAFLQEEISQEDKFLLLQGKILAEEYGTYGASDVRSLMDIQNQATEDFNQKVQKIIDSVPAGKDLVTIVDPDSIEFIDQAEGAATIKMNAVTTDKNTNKSTNISTTVELIKDNEYWLVDNITVSNR